MERDALVAERAARRDLIMRTLFTALLDTDKKPSSPLGIIVAETTTAVATEVFDVLDSLGRIATALERVADALDTPEGAFNRIACQLDKLSDIEMSVRGISRV